MRKILILGGTAEASELATQLVAQGHDVTTSLAGRTKEPEPVSGKLRIGGFGGTPGLADYIRTNAIEKLIDATHPFAKKISENAFKAAQETSIEFEKIERAPWKMHADDCWIEVPDLDTACNQIPKAARVLLALGSQHLSAFAKRADVFFLIRTVDPPSRPFCLPNHELIIGKPSTDWKEEQQMLRNHDISHIVCRNSGGTGAYAKIEAARSLHLPVIIIAR